MSVVESSVRWGIQFDTLRDDLDEFAFALLVPRIGRPFALARYANNPAPGVEIRTYRESKDLTADLQNALSALGLESTALNWIHPEITLKPE